jgi:CubicO group peptidase (beta-lactamase class C family)
MKTNPMRRIAFALVLFAAVITAASARQNNSPAAAFDRVREFIKQQLGERRLPSVAVAVARDGKIIWEEAFGWADVEKRIPATPHTMYSLASISKPITATGLMILKERGRIELDRPINEYLGEAKIAVRVGNPADATVRRERPSQRNPAIIQRPLPNPAWRLSAYNPPEGKNAS